MSGVDSDWSISAKLIDAGVSVVAATAIVELVASDSLLPLATALVGAGAVVAGAWLAGRWQVRQTETQLRLTNRAAAYLSGSRIS